MTLGKPLEQRKYTITEKILASAALVLTLGAAWTVSSLNHRANENYEAVRPILETQQINEDLNKLYRDKLAQ